MESDPITLAKAVATLDHPSGGRVTIGAGFGWNIDELADHGVPGERRRTFAWIARHADGWMTTPREDDVDTKVSLLREAWTAAGRDGAPAVQVLATSKPTPELLDGWEAAGVTEAIWGLPVRDSEEVVAFIGRHAARLGLG